MAEQYSYRNLILWNKAQDLTLAVIRLVSPLPRSPLTDTLSYQIIKSSSSIAANIAEGHGRYSLGAHINHLSIAKGSTTETDSWLDLLHRSGLIGAETEATLHESCNEIIAMLIAKIHQLEKLAPAKGRKLSDERVEWNDEASSSKSAPYSEAELVLDS